MALGNNPFDIDLPEANSNNPFDVDLPEIDTPKVDAPSTDIPEVDAPKFDLKEAMPSYKSIEEISAPTKSPMGFSTEKSAMGFEDGKLADQKTEWTSDLDTKNVLNPKYFGSDPDPVKALETARTYKGIAESNAGSSWSTKEQALEAKKKVSEIDANIAEYTRTLPDRLVADAEKKAYEAKFPDDAMVAGQEQIEPKLNNKELGLKYIEATNPDYGKELRTKLSQQKEAAKETKAEKDAEQGEVFGKKGRKEFAQFDDGKYVGDLNKEEAANLQKKQGEYEKEFGVKLEIRSNEIFEGDLLTKSYEEKDAGLEFKGIEIRRIAAQNKLKEAQGEADRLLKAAKHLRDEKEKIEQTYGTPEGFVGISEQEYARYQEIHTAISDINANPDVQTTLKAQAELINTQTENQEVLKKYPTLNSFLTVSKNRQNEADRAAKDNGWVEYTANATAKGLADLYTNFLTSIYTFPRTLTPTGSYNFADKIADTAVAAADVANKIGFPNPTNLEREFMEDRAVVANYQASIKDGKVIDVRDADGYAVSPFEASAISQMYERNPSLYPVEKVVNARAGAYQLYVMGLEMGLWLVPSITALSKVGMAAGLSKKAAGVFGMFGAITAQMHNDLYQGATEGGMTEMEGTLFTIANTAGVSAISFLNPLESRLAQQLTSGRFKSAAAGSAQRYVEEMLGRKVSYNVALKNSWHSFKNGLGEKMEEGLELKLQQETEQLANSLTGTNFEKHSTNEFASSMVLGFIGGVGFSMLEWKSRPTMARGAMYDAIQNQDRTMQSIDGMIGKKDRNGEVITKERAEAFKEDFKVLSERTKSIIDKGKLDDEQGTATAELVRKKMTLERENEKENVDDVVVKANKQNIATINQQLELLAGRKAGDAYFDVDGVISDEAGVKKAMKDAAFVADVAKGRRYVVISDPELRKQFAGEIKKFNEENAKTEAAELEVYAKERQAITDIYEEDWEGYTDEQQDKFRAERERIFKEDKKLFDAHATPEQKAELKKLTKKGFLELFYTKDKKRRTDWERHGTETSYISDVVDDILGVKKAETATPATTNNTTTTNSNTAITPDDIKVSITGSNGGFGLKAGDQIDEKDIRHVFDDSAIQESVTSGEPLQVTESKAGGKRVIRVIHGTVDHVGRTGVSIINVELPENSSLTKEQVAELASEKIKEKTTDNKQHEFYGSAAEVRSVYDQIIAEIKQKGTETTKTENNVSQQGTKGVGTNPAGNKTVGKKDGSEVVKGDGKEAPAEKSEKEKIEDRRKKELGDWGLDKVLNEGDYVPDDYSGKLKLQKEINDKYDAELAALEKPKTNEKTDETASKTDTTNQEGTTTQTGEPSKTQTSPVNDASETKDADTRKAKEEEIADDANALFGVDVKFNPDGTYEITGEGDIEGARTFVDEATKEIKKPEPKGTLEEQHEAIVKRQGEIFEKAKTDAAARAEYNSLNKKKQAIERQLFQEKKKNRFKEGSAKYIEFERVMEEFHNNSRPLLRKVFDFIEEFGTLTFEGNRWLDLIGTAFGDVEAMKPILTLVRQLAAQLSYTNEGSSAMIDRMVQSEYWKKALKGVYRSKDINAAKMKKRLGSAVMNGIKGYSGYTEALHNDYKKYKEYQKKGYLKGIPKSDEAPVKEEPKAPLSEARQFGVDFANAGLVETREIGGRGNEHQRLDLRMSNDEKIRAVKDIKEGNYETTAAKMMLDRIEQMYNEGALGYVMGSGGSTQQAGAVLIEDAKKHIEDIKQGKEEAPKEEAPKPTENEPFHNATAESIPEEIHTAIVDRIKNALSQAFGTAVHIVKDAKELMKAANKQPLFHTKDGNPIGFTYDTDQVARERFDLSKLKQIGKGSDRTVFDLGNGKVLKIAHTARGLAQNIYEGDGYLAGDVIPEVHERGLNYVVTDNAPRLKAADIVPVYDWNSGEEVGTERAGDMMKELAKFSQIDFDEHNADLEAVLAKYGFTDIFSYDVMYNDFAAMRNWGFKDGKPLHIDGGTFGGVQRILNAYRGKTSMQDADFRAIYNKSRAVKKGNKETDKFTKFQDEKGVPLGFADRNGDIWLNGEKINGNTPIHEAGHLWQRWAAEHAPNLLKAGLDKISRSPYLAQVRNNKFYIDQADKQGLKGKEREDFFRNEALAMAIGDKGEQFVSEAKKADFKAWLAELWKAVAEFAGLSEKTAAQIENMTLDEFAKAVAADLLSGKPLKGKVEGKEGGEFAIIGDKGIKGLEQAEKYVADLGIARDMESAGESAKDIRWATGWEKGVDGKWRYEIPDVEINGEVNKLPTDRTQQFDKIYTYKKVKLSDIITDDKGLFKAYPEAKDIEVVLYDFSHPDGTSGTYREGNKWMPEDTITLWDVNYESGLSERQKGTLLHEIQHHIQHKEGFAVGASPSGISQADIPLNPKFAEYNTPENKKRAEEYQRLRNSPEYAQELFESNELFTKEYAPRIDALNEQMIRGDRAQNNAISAQVQEIFDEYSELQKEKFPTMTAADEIAKRTIVRAPDKNISRFDAYLRVAGEVEARNVQARMNMTPDERRATLLSETEKIARNEQIILRESAGVSDSSKDKNQLDLFNDSTEEPKSETGVTANKDTRVSTEKQKPFKFTKITDIPFVGRRGRVDAGNGYEISALATDDGDGGVMYNLAVIKDGELVSSDLYDAKYNDKIPSNPVGFSMGGTMENLTEEEAVAEINKKLSEIADHNAATSTKLPEKKTEKAKSVRPTKEEERLADIKRIERERDHTLYKIEDFEDEINNVKSDLKETIEGIRKEIAEVRAAKMSKSAREEKLEDLKYDIENAKDEAESLISAYKDDIAMEKGDLRRYARQLAKLGQAIPSYSNFSHRASDAVQKLIKQGAKTKDILKQVVSEGGEYSELAQAILTYGDAAGLEVPIRKHSGDFAGQYYPHLDKIDIDKGSVNDLATILHEIIHGMTSKKIPQSLGSGLSTGADYLKVLNEYIANGSNPAVKELAKTYLEAVKQSGHWDALFKGTSKGNTIRSKIYWTGSIGNPRAFARFWFDTPREANKAIAMFKKLGVERVFPRQNRTIIEIRAEDLEKLKTAGIKIDSPKDRAPLTKENTTLHKRDGINGQEYVHELVSENKREFAYPHETLGKTDSEIHDLLIEKANKGNYDNGTIELSTISKTGALANKTNAVADSVIPYGFANLDEFLAEGFTNPKFQEILNTMKMPSGNKSLWQAFVDAVSKIMGLVGKSVNKGSILEKFIKEGANLINQERREPARATTAAELENTGTEAIIANLDNLSFVEKIKLSIFLHDKVARSKSKNAGYYKIETANRKNLLDIFEGRKTDAESIKQAKIDLNSTRALYRKWQASGKDTAWSSKWLAVYDALYEALEKGEYVEQKGQLTLFKRNAQAAAAKIREGKLHKKGQLSAASPMSLAIDAAIEAVALTTELTGALAELLDMALIELRNSDAYKSRKSQLARDTAEAQLKAKLKERISNAKATARAEEPKEKKHKLPVRVIASPHVPDDIKQGVLDKGITYVEETRAMTDAAAKGLMDAYAAQGDLDAVLDYVANPSNKIDMPIRVALEQAIYVSFAEKAVEATRNGDLEEAETNRRKAVDVLHLAQKTGLEAGRAVNKQKDWARLTDADPEALVFDVQSQFDEKNKPVLEKHNETIKTAQEKLRELLESEEGKALFKAKVEEKVAAEQNRPVRKSHIDKAMDALDKAHIKLRSMNFVDLSGVTVAMVDGAFAAAKVTLRTTQSVLEAVETAVKYVKEELAKAGINDWAKEDAFRQAVEESLTADGIRVPKKKTPKQQKVQQKKDVAQGLRDQLDSLDALIKDPVKALEALEAKKKKAEERVAANESKSEEIKALENEIAVRKKLLSLVQGMEGITDAQKKEILSEALDSIIKNGYLSEPAFRQMFAKALGLETLTAKDEQIIRKGAAVIQNVSAAQRRYLADPTPENLKAYRKAVREGRLANEVVSRYFRERSTLGGLFSTFIRGNLLSTTTVVLSGVSNVATSPVRWANNAIASSIDFLRYQLSRVAWLSRNVKYLENKRFNDFFGNQREYYAGLPEGLKEGILQLWSGSIPDEVFEREMKGGLHPLEALMRVYNHVGQKEKQKIMESLVDGMEATLGVAPELIFRLLNVTDKPFRTASSKAALGELVKLELAHLKKELLKKPTLTQQEAELLRDIRSGKEYQRRMIEPSEAISEKAGEEGSAGVFQNKSMLLAAIEGASKAIAAEHKKRYGESTEKPSLLWATLKGLGKIASAATFPFINMPANWVEQTILYTNPLIALGLAGVHAKVGNVRKANQLLATAAIGVMLSQAALWIIVNGIARGSAGDDDDDERQKAYARGGYKRINWSLFQRQFTGGSKNWEEGDLTMEFYQMGLTGSVLLSYVDLYKNYREEMAKQNNIAADFFSKGFYKFGSSVTTGLDMPTVQGTNMMLNALSSGDEKAFDKVMIQTANALKAIYLPSTYIKGQKALDKDAFLKNVKDDDWWQQFKNSYKYQMGNGGDLPNKHTSWGEPILKTPSDRNAWVYNLLDITKASKIPESTFGLELYNLHDRLKKENSELANGVLPPVLGKSITINEVTHKLSEAEYETYLQFVGQRRKEIVSRYIENGVNDMMFSTDSDEQRVKNLTDLYAIAAKVGRTQFVEKMGWNVEEEVEDDVLDDIGVTEEDFTEPPPPVIRQRMNYFDTKNL